MSSKAKSLKATKRRVTFSTVTQRPKIVAAVKETARRVKEVNTSLDINSSVTDLMQTVTSSLRNPVVLLTLLAASALVVTHSSNFSSGLVGQWIKSNPSNNLAVWISANSSKFLGLVIFAPSVIASPKNLRVFLAIALLLWTMIVPESGITQYVVQSVSVFLYFRVRQPNTRIFIIAACAAIYYFGWFAFDETKPQQPLTSSQNKQSP